MLYRVTRLQPVKVRKTPRPLESFARARRSEIPLGGWTQQSFQSDNGKRLIRDILMVRQLAIRENVPKMTKAVNLLLEQQVNEVLTSFANRVRKHHAKTIGSDLATIVLTLKVPDGMEAMWEDAINDVFKSENIMGRIIRVFRPVYQSVMDHIVRKTSVLIAPDTSTPPAPEGHPSRLPSRQTPIPVTTIESPDLPPAPRPPTEKQQAAMITAKADNLCMKVTKIDETTRNRLRAVFKAKIQEGATIGEVIKVIKEQFPTIATNRVPTIVRNELSMAANAAQILSFKGSRVLTHCSVVGCQAVEENSPLYHDFHTCNIRNVPVEDLELVEFHINHTGSWVPSGFRNEDGTVPNLRLGNSPGIGHFDNPNALRHTNPRAAGLDTVTRPR